MIKKRNDKLLIISYTFPPSSGIGGRRWAKFAKYLNRWGIDVFVFTKIPNSKENSQWSKDVENLQNENRIIQVKNPYPSIFDETPNSFLKKIKYRIALLYVKFRLKGNYYDRSALWSDELLKQLGKKIKKGYKTIVATAAPYTYLYELLKLKEKYPGLKLIADFRDPWTNNRIAYGYGTISTKRMSRELFYEKEVIKKFDLIVSVDDTHIDYFKSIYSDGNYLMIPNGFDPEDCIIPSNKVSRKDNKIRLIYAGTLYEHSEYIFKEFIDELVVLKNTKPKLFNQLEFHFYGVKQDSFNKYFNHKDLSKTIFHFGIIPLDQVYEEIQNSDLCMLFLTDQMNYTKNTKFYESIYMKKKIAVFSSPGSLEKYVVKNNIGYSFTPGKIQDGFNKLLIDFEQDNFDIPENYNVDPYSIPNILEGYLQEIFN